MIEETQMLERKAAYLDGLRAVGRPQRRFGFAAVAVGAAVLAWATIRGGGALSPAGLAGITVLTAGWTLFVYVTIKRSLHVRAHPFNPNV